MLYNVQCIKPIFHFSCIKSFIKLLAAILTNLFWYMTFLQPSYFIVEASYQNLFLCLFCAVLAFNNFCIPESFNTNISHLLFGTNLVGNVSTTIYLSIYLSICLPVLYLY